MGKKHTQPDQGHNFPYTERDHHRPIYTKYFFSAGFVFLLCCQWSKKRNWGCGPYCKRLVPCNYTIFYSDLVIIEDLRKDIFGGGKGVRREGGRGKREDIVGDCPVGLVLTI